MQIEGKLKEIQKTILLKKLLILCESKFRLYSFRIFFFASNFCIYPLHLTMFRTIGLESSIPPTNTYFQCNSLFFINSI